MKNSARQILFASAVPALFSLPCWGQGAGGHQVTPQTTQYTVKVSVTGQTIFTLGAPSVASEGTGHQPDDHVAFWMNTTDPLLGQVIATWTNVGAVERSVANSGTGSPFSSFSTTRPPHVRGDGTVGFHGSTASGQGIHTESFPGVLATHVDESDQAPNGDAFQNIEEDSGRSLTFGSDDITFQGLTQPGGMNTNGLYRAVGSPPVLTKNTVEGDGVPNFPGESFLTMRGAGQDSGFDGSINTAFVSSTNGANSEGIWKGSTAGGLTRIASALVNDPGLGGGAFSGYSSARLNSIGTVAFRGIAGGFSGIWSGSDEFTLTRVVIEGEDALDRQGQPIDPGVATFKSFSNPSLNNHGRAAILATLENGDEGVWAQTSPGGPLKLIAMTGTAIRGKSYSFSKFFPNGGLYDVPGFDLVAINDQYQVAFMAELDNNSYGLYVWDSSTSAMIEIVRTGTNYGLPGGGSPLIDIIDWFPGSNENGVSGFAHDGSIAYKVSPIAGTNPYTRVIALTTIDS